MAKSLVIRPEEIKAENGLEIGRLIFEHTPVIYYINKRNKPEPVASAVALKCEDDLFIVTAAHTVKNFENHSLGMIPGSHWIELRGEYVISDGGTIENDKFDTAVYKLESATVGKLPSDLVFFDLAKFLPDHEDIKGQSYMIVGHPISKVKLKHSEGRKVIAPFIYMSDLNQQDNMFFNQGLGS